MNLRVQHPQFCHRDLESERLGGEALCVTQVKGLCWEPQTGNPKNIVGI